jgi:hypothetical protein
MRIVDVRYTRGDNTTTPGGIMIKQETNGDYVVTHFERDLGQLEPTSFFWGAYPGKNLVRAREIFAEKVANRFGMLPHLGGSLIERSDMEAELAKEKERLAEL